MKQLVMAVLALVVGLNVYAADAPSSSKPAASPKKPATVDCPDKAPSKAVAPAAAAATPGLTTTATAAPEPKVDAAAAQALAQKYACLACHQVDKKVVGPSLKEIAAKYKGDKGALTSLAKKVKEGGAGNWGAVPMPPHPQVPDADIRTMVLWIMGIK